VDDYFKLFMVDKVSGKIVPDECVNLYNPDVLEEKVLVEYPLELQKWATSKGLGLATLATCAASLEYSSAYTNGYSDVQAAGVIVDSPANNDEFILSNLLPLEDQKVPLRVTPPAFADVVLFFVDDVLVGTQNETPFTYLWLPNKGVHIFYAKTKLKNGSDIQSPSTSFSVF